MDSLVMPLLDNASNVSTNAVVGIKLYTTFLFPVPTGYHIALNATIYYAEILSDYPLNGSVFKIRVYFSSTAGLLDAHISLSQTGQINDLFEFEGGSDNRISVSTGDFISIGDHSVFDAAINLVRRPEAVFAESDYPVDLHISITFNTLFLPDVSRQRQSIGSGTIYLAPGENVIISLCMGHCDKPFHRSM